MTDSLNELAHRLHENRSKRVYAYLRVSSDKQSRDGASLDVQEKEVKEYCEREGLGDPLIVSEIGSAGKRMFSLPRLAGTVPATEGTDADQLGRPIFMLLLGHLTNLKNGHLVVWKLDRFSRFSDEQEVLYQLLVRADVRLHSTAEGEARALTETPDDPMATLMRQILGAFAQYERRLIEVRMSSGLRLKASRGGYSGGRPPYGYEAKSGELRVRPDQAPIVRYIYMLHRKYGVTQADIAKRLSEALEEPFSPMRVSRVLHNEDMYRGIYCDVYGDTHDRDDLVILNRADYSYERETSNDHPTE